jgi:hypothetical protein
VKNSDTWPVRREEAREQIDSWKYGKAGNACRDPNGMFATFDCDSACNSLANKPVCKKICNELNSSGKENLASGPPGKPIS